MSDGRQMTKAECDSPGVRWGVVVWLLVVVWWGPAEVSAQVETFEYTVEQGDTCESIAEEFYGHVGGCDLIEKYNAEEGGEPNLTPGNVLELPTKVARAEALVDRKHGSVRARDPEQSWRPAEIGDELYRAWRVNTLQRARAELAFRNASQLKMREQTLVIIYGGSREDTERDRTRATLQEGKLRSKLDELAGGGGMEVDSPSAQMALGVGESLLGVDEEKTTRVANHGGEPIEVTGKGSASNQTVSVAENMGTKVEQGSAPTPPRKLPPSPGWTSEPVDVLAFGDEERTVRAAWEPVDEAEEYFVEFAADRQGIEVIRSVYVPADVTSLEVRELPPGSYFATVSTIDAEGFESIPSERREIRVVAIEYDEAQRLEGEQEPTFALGARLSAPGETACAVGDGEAEPAVRLEAVGEQEFRCRRAGGDWTVRRTIAVAKPEVEVGGRDVGEEGEVAFRRGRFGLVELAFAPSLPPGVQYVFPGVDEGALVAAPTPTGQRRVRVRIEAGEQAPSEAILEVRSSRGATLVEVPVRVAEAPAEQEREPVDEPDGPGRALRVGALGGAFGELGPGDESLGVGAGGGAVVSYLAARHFALEAWPRAVWRPRSGVRYGLDTRAMFSVPLEAVEPFVGAGFGVHGSGGGGEWRPVLGAAAGAGWWFGSAWGLRAQFGADLAFAGGEPVWMPRLQAGVVYRWR